MRVPQSERRKDNFEIVFDECSFAALCSVFLSQLVTALNQTSAFDIKLIFGYLIGATSLRHHLKCSSVCSTAILSISFDINGPSMASF